MNPLFGFLNPSLHTLGGPPSPKSIRARAKASIRSQTGLILTKIPGPAPGQLHSKGKKKKSK